MALQTSSLQTSGPQSNSRNSSEYHGSNALDLLQQRVGSALDKMASNPSGANGSAGISVDNIKEMISCLAGVQLPGQNQNCVV
jgi:hypothetical protein